MANALLEQFDEALIVEGAALLADWLQSQRALHRKKARRIPERMLDQLRPWFDSETLQIARVRSVTEIDPPAFIEALLSGANLPFKKMTGLALIDTILVTKRRPDTEIIFHELVHLAQFRRLGVEGFAEAYVRGLVAARLDYSANPMESRAFTLQHLFEQGKVSAFCIETACLPGDKIDAEFSLELQ